MKIAKFLIVSVGLLAAAMASLPSYAATATAVATASGSAPPPAPSRPPRRPPSQC